MDNIEVNDVINMADAINKYGWATIVLAVFLVLLITIVVLTIGYVRKSTASRDKEHTETMTTIQTQQNQMFENLIKRVEQQQESQQELIASLMKQLVETKSAQEHSAENIVGVFVKLNEALKGECKDAQNETGADRLAIYVFHNGTYSSHNLPFFKMSCISEWLQPRSGLVPELQQHTNIPLSLFEGMVTRLFSNSDVIIPDTEAIKTSDPLTYAFVSSTKIKACMLVSIYDDDDQIMGFVCGEFRSVLSEDEINLKKRMLYELAIKVKPVLQYSDFQKCIPTTPNIPN